MRARERWPGSIRKMNSHPLHAKKFKRWQKCVFDKTERTWRPLSVARMCTGMSQWDTINSKGLNFDRSKIAKSPNKWNSIGFRKKSNQLRSNHAKSKLQNRMTCKSNSANFIISRFSVPALPPSNLPNMIKQLSSIPHARLLSTYLAAVWKHRRSANRRNSTHFIWHPERWHLRWHLWSIWNTTDAFSRSP